MFCEWRAPGFETQKSSLYDAGANQTGDAQGIPPASAVPSVMYRLPSTIALAIASRSLTSIGRILPITGLK